MKATKNKQFSNVAREYGESTSLHGLKYIVELNQSRFERFIWILIVSAALAFGIFLTIRILNKLDSSPIITTLDDTNVPLNGIPFPAVTICPNYQGIKKKIINEICTDPPVENATILSGLLFLTVGPLLNIPNIYEYADAIDVDLYELEQSFNITRIVKFLKKVSPRCKDYILKCKWQGKTVDCAKVFSLTSTDVGFCCSFNIIPPLYNLNDVGSAIGDDFAILNEDYEEEDEPDEDYGDYGQDGKCPDTPIDHDAENETELWKEACSEAKIPTSNTTSTLNSTKEKSPFVMKNFTGPGLNKGLSVLVDTLACGWPSTSLFDGVKVLIHNPDAFPEIGLRGTLLNHGTVNFLSVHTVITET